MSDRSGRKKQPFRFWFPPKRTPSQASKQPKPPSTPPQSPPAPPPSSPQLDDGDRAQPPSPSSRPTVTAQAEAPGAQVGSEELVEEKTKPEFESAQVAETEISSAEPETEAQLEKIQEEKSELDLEAPQVEPDERPIKTAETEEITEQLEQGLFSAEPEKEIKPKISIEVSDLVETGEIPEESTNGGLIESKRKITICTVPERASSSQNLGELKDGLSRLVQKLSFEQGVNIITLASENQGASMFIGSEVHPGKKNETREGNFHNVKGNQAIVASINSNVQGVNSSILDETSYRERNPGVHMTITTKPLTAPVSITGRTEIKKAACGVRSPEKLSYEPNIRRRCLRGLFMESSEDDGLKKPRRHGCRFSCDDKTKGKT